MLSPEREWKLTKKSTTPNFSDSFVDESYHFKEKSNSVSTCSSEVEGGLSYFIPNIYL